MTKYLTIIIEKIKSLVYNRTKDFFINWSIIDKEHVQNSSNKENGTRIWWRVVPPCNLLRFTKEGILMLDLSQ